MFYEPINGHNLASDPLNAIIIPRPIGWISTLSEGNIPNLAPYSFFNAVAYEPPQVMFAATSNHAFGGLKDAVMDAQNTGEFVVNLATWDLRVQMNDSAVPAPRDIDEFKYTGLTQEKSEIVRCPRVKESPVHLECRYIRSIDMLSNVIENRHLRHTNMKPIKDHNAAKFDLHKLSPSHEALLSVDCRTGLR